MASEYGPIKRVVLLVNGHKPEAVRYAGEAAEVLRQNGIEFFAPGRQTIGPEGYSGNEVMLLAQDLSAVPREDLPQLAIVFGGDGTMILAARALSPFGVPLTGVNLGGLGFLMPLEPDELPGILLQIVQGEYYLEKRTQIRGELWRGGRPVAADIAQNDIVINNGGISRMIGIKLCVDGRPALTMRGDGVVVATPTGSTAYSLSAGGSIVMPETEVMLVTPVAAHSLHTRPLVVSAGSSLSITLGNINSPVLLSFDGQHFLDVEPDDEIVIRQSESRALFVWPRAGMFFDKLNAKLRI